MPIEEHVDQAGRALRSTPFPLIQAKSATEPWGEAKSPEIGYADRVADEYHFGEFRLLPYRSRLLRGHKIIPLPSRATRLLIFLVERHSRIVSRDEIFADVWAGVTVGDAALWKQIRLIRIALGSQAVKTLPGYGYRFGMEVRQPEALSIAARASDPPADYVPPGHFERPGLVGRSDELAEVLDLMARNRLVTIAGPGGVGKTRLVIELGQRVAGKYRDGVWLIDLAPLIDPALAVSATATVLGVPLGNTETSIEALVAAIAKRRLVLIFDNCECLVSAAADLIQTLLNRVPGVSVLVTSQEILRLPTESVYRLDPLALPPDTNSQQYKADEIVSYSAIELFVTRARAADRRFRLNDGNALEVAAICRALEGLPLALEMAAARLEVLGVKGLHRCLGERLAVLVDRSRIGDARHRSLRAMVEWSHSLLDPADQEVFRRLAVFRGGFSLDAAVAVVGADGAETWAAVDALQRLIDKSLVMVEAGETPRYRMLETLRIFAIAALEASGEREKVAGLHARYYADFFDGADIARQTILDFQWHDLYVPEIDNVRAALEWTMADPRRETMAIALVSATAILWHVLDLHREGRSYFSQVENLVKRHKPGADAARLLRWGAIFSFNQDRSRGLVLLEQSLEIFRGLNQPVRLAEALSQMGHWYIYVGRFAAARGALAEAQKILSADLNNKILAMVATELGYLARRNGNDTEARRCFSRALDLSRAARDGYREGYSLIHLAELEFKIGAVEVAVERAREAVSAMQSVQHRVFLGIALGNLSAYLVATGNLAEAPTLAKEALQLVRERGGRVVTDRLQLWALLGALMGRLEAAATLAGYVNSCLVAPGEGRDETEQYLNCRLSEILKNNFLPSVIERHAAEGAKWSEGEAVDFVFDHIISSDLLIT